MKRVLFVDDQPNILSGLKRMLRSQRNVWDMTFAESGEEALASMEAQPVDVLVTDMRMPGMDGSALLAEARERHPRTVRIILSGESDVDSAMRSTQVSHQFLAKPCDADSLRSVVDRACRLGEVLTDPVLQESLGRISELPVLPRVYSELNSALRDEEVDIREVGDIVEQDLAISTKILQLVNSSYFGIKKEITDIHQATNYLGINTIRSLVLTLELFKNFDGTRRVPGFSFEAEQTHCMLVARIARRLAEDKQTAELAFLAAMLHDVGKLVLASELPSHFARVELAAKRFGGDHLRAETEVLGTTHAEIGAYLLDLWGMPYPIVEAVANHHFPARVPDQSWPSVLALTHVADALAYDGVNGSTSESSVDEDYLGSLGVLERLPQWREIAEAEAGAKEAA